MCNNGENNSCSGIAEILSIINVLQKNACSSGACIESCDRGFLSCGMSNRECNTRPVELYLSNGQPLRMPTSREVTTCDDPGETCSSVFRVEKVDDCTATFRVLAPNTSTESTNPYILTNSYFTMNLNCCCSLRCLSDTYVEGL